MEANQETSLSKRIENLEDIIESLTGTKLDGASPSEFKVDHFNSYRSRNLDAVDSTEPDQGVVGKGSTIKNLVDHIGTTKKATIYLPHYSVDGDTTIYTLGTSETIPSNITLEIQPGAILANSEGVTLTINGPFGPGSYQVFSGSGVVAGLRKANVHWWGPALDYSTDNASKVQAAIDSIAIGYYAGGWVYVPPRCKYTKKEQDHVLSATKIYRVTTTHLSAPATEPGVGGSWATVWEKVDDTVVTDGGIPWVTATTYTISNPNGVVFKDNVNIDDNVVIFYPKKILIGNAFGSVDNFLVEAGYNPGISVNVNSNWPLENMTAVQGRGNRATIAFMVDGVTKWAFEQDPDNVGSNDLALVSFAGYRQYLLLGKQYGRIRYGKRSNLSYDLNGLEPEFAHSFMGIVNIEDAPGSNANLVFRIMDTDDASVLFSKYIRLNGTTGSLEVRSTTNTDILTLTEAGHLDVPHGVNGGSNTTAERNAGAFTAGVAAGTMVWDQTLQKPVWWTGTVWKDAAGVEV